MLNRIPNVIRAGTLLLLTAVFAAPTATAGRYDRDHFVVRNTPGRGALQRGTCHQYCGAVGTSMRTVEPASQPSIRTEIVYRDRSFQWLDAALGFGVACGAMLIGAGVFTVSRRSNAGGAKAALSGRPNGTQFRAGKAYDSSIQGLRSKP
jgi:hypothetical protein